MVGRRRHGGAVVNVAKWYAEMLSWDGTEASFEIKRTRVQEGATFSADAMDELNAQLVAFVGTRLMRRWKATNEPPSVLRVDITVVAS